MIFAGTETECAEVVAELDAALGYPRGYTQADVDSGLVQRVGGGIHVPLEMLRTETVARPMPVEVDAEGQPLTGARVVRLRSLGDDHRRKVARRRVLRMIALGPAAMQALRDYALTRVGDDDTDEAALAARRAQA